MSSTPLSAAALARYNLLATNASGVAIVATADIPADIQELVDIGLVGLVVAGNDPTLTEAFVRGVTPNNPQSPVHDGQWVDTVTGPIWLAAGLPQTVIDESIADAGGLATMTSQPPPATSPGDAGTPGVGYWADTVTGPVWIAQGLPQWVIDETIRDAGGLAPGPASQVQIPTRTGAPTVTQTPGSTGSPSQILGLTGMFTAPPDGIPLNLDFSALAKHFGDVLNPAPTDDSADLDTLLAGIAAHGEELGYGTPGEWNGVVSFLKAVLTLNPFNPAYAAAGANNRIDKVQTGVANGAGLVDAGLAAGSSAFPDLMRALASSGAGEHMQQLQQAYEQLFEQVHADLLSVLEVGDPDDPTSAEQRAARALEIALGAGTTAHGLALSLELLQPLKQMGFGQIAALVADAAGFHPITDALWRNAIEASIARPLKAVYNARFPTETPGFIDVLNFGRRHEYDATPPVGALNVPQGFVDDMAEHGFSMRRIEQFWEHVSTVPRLYDVIRLADTLLNPGPPSPDIVPALLRVGTDPEDPYWFTDYQLRQSGFATWTVDLYKRAIVHRASATDRNAQMTENGQQLRGGYITEAVYRQRAEDLGERPETIDFGATTNVMVRSRNNWTDLETQWTNSFLKDQISADELNTNLALFVTDDAERGIKVAIAQMKHDIATKAKVATAEEQAVGASQRTLVAAYRQQFRAGLIGADQLHASVMAAGFTDAYATAVVYAETVTQEAKAKTTTLDAFKAEAARVTELLAQSYEVQFKDGQLTADQLKASFIGAGLSEAVAGARTARAMAQQVATANKAAATAAAAAARQLDATTKTAATHAASEAASAASKLSTAFLEEVKALHTEKVITTDQLYQALLDAGWTQDLAATIAATEAARAKEDPWEPGQPSLDGPVAPTV